MTRRKQDRRSLFKAQLVFWLLGATDGHAKNFSVRLAPGGRFSLTPLYDIMSTQPNLDADQIQRKQMRLAMAVGTRRHYIVDLIVPRHFEQTAGLCGFPAQSLAALVEELRDTAAAAIDKTLARLPPNFPESLAASIAEGAKRRVNLLRASTEAEQSTTQD